MPDATPAQPQPVQRRQVIRLVASTAAAALGIGYTLHDPGQDVLAAAARHMVTVAVIVLALWIAENRQDHRLSQQDRRLFRIESQLDTRLQTAARAEGYLQGVEHTMAMMQEPHLHSVP